MNVKITSVLLAIFITQLIIFSSGEQKSRSFLEKTIIEVKIREMKGAQIIYQMTVPVFQLIMMANNSKIVSVPQSQIEGLQYAYAKLLNFISKPINPKLLGPVSSATRQLTGKALTIIDALESTVAYLEVSGYKAIAAEFKNMTSVVSDTLKILGRKPQDLALLEIDKLEELLREKYKKSCA